MTTAGTPLRRVAPERLKHELGEALLRRDIADQSAQDDQLRWWHTRALHGAWGIAEGLNVSGVAPGSTAKLSAGVAFDLFGRELVLDRVQRIPVPETADEFLLVISYDRPLAGCEPPAGACQSSVVAASGVRLGWMLRRTFAPAFGVPLAILNEDDTCPPKFARPYVRPQTRPTIGHGVVTISSQHFTPWREKLGGEPFQLGWEFAIDTRAAGFTRPPYYFAEISVPVKDAPLDLIYFVGRHHLADGRRDRFSVRYFSSTRDRIGGSDPFYADLSDDAFLRFATVYTGNEKEGDFEFDVPLRISWIGVEPRPRSSGFSRFDLRLESEVNDEFHS